MRVPPLPDELASSWLTRLLWKLSLDPSRAFPLPMRPVSLHGDPAIPEPLAASLAAGGLPAAPATRLLFPPDTPAPFMAVRDLPSPVPALAIPLGLAEGSAAWLLNDLRPTRAAGGAHPLAYCPACLAADEEPYFRRAWRLAFPVTCLRHGLVLRDRCPDCGAHVAPWQLRRARLEEPGVAADLSRCWRCLGDLRAAPRHRAMPEVHLTEQRMVAAWALARLRGSNILGRLRHPAFNEGVEAFLWRAYRLPRNRRAFRYLNPQVRHEAALARLGWLERAVAWPLPTEWDESKALARPPEAARRPPRGEAWRYRPTTAPRPEPAPVYHAPAALIAWCSGLVSPGRLGTRGLAAAYAEFKALGGSAAFGAGLPAGTAAPGRQHGTARRE